MSFTYSCACTHGNVLSSTSKSRSTEYCSSRRVIVSIRLLERATKKPRVRLVRDGVFSVWGEMRQSSRLRLPRRLEQLKCRCTHHTIQNVPRALPSDYLNIFYIINLLIGDHYFAVCYSTIFIAG